MSIETRGVLREFIQEQLMSGRATADVGDDADLLTSGILDSLGAFSLVYFIEQTFGIEVPAQDVTIENFSTIATIEAYITAPRG